MPDFKKLMDAEEYNELRKKALAHKRAMEAVERKREEESEEKEAQEGKQMSKDSQFSFLLGDIIRWVFAILTYPFVLYLIFLFFNFPFDWLMRQTTKLNVFLHLLIWFIVSPTILGLGFAFAKVLAKISTYIVRQKNTYAVILSLLILLNIVIGLFMGWSKKVDLPWEVYNHILVNRIIHSLWVLSLLAIPLNLLDSDDY